jgi:hypothetical protein
MPAKSDFTRSLTSESTAHLTSSDSDAEDFAAAEGQAVHSESSASVSLLVK